LKWNINVFLSRLKKRDMKKSTHAIMSIVIGIVIMPWLSVEGWKWLFTILACYIAGMLD
jgi:hypothetical protein